jgi:dynein heavy chain
MLCCDVLKSRMSIQESDWNFFLRGASGMESNRTKKPPEAYWVTTKQWEIICDLESSFEVFENFSASVLKDVVKIHIGAFRTTLFDRRSASVRPTDRWDKKLNKFQKLILIKNLAEQTVKPYNRMMILDILTF